MGLRAGQEDPVRCMFFAMPLLLSGCYYPYGYYPYGYGNYPYGYYGQAH